MRAMEDDLTTEDDSDPDQDVPRDPLARLWYDEVGYLTREVRAGTLDVDDAFNALYDLERIHPGAQNAYDAWAWEDVDAPAEEETPLENHPSDP